MKSRRGKERKSVVYFDQQTDASQVFEVQTEVLSMVAAEMKTG